MKHHLLALLLTAFVVPVFSQDTPPRTALVMGVGDYGGAKFKGGTIPNLPGITMADLPGMEAKLKSLGFSVTVVSNPTLSEAKEAVDAFSARIKASPGVSLFYFSGHGGEYEGKNYLIPRGANISSKADLSDEALSAQRVLNGMEESGAQVNLVFLDCCREDLGKSVGGAELQPMKARGSFIGFATRSGDFADPGAEGSPYTRFLLQHLDRPGLSVADMYGYVIKDVKDYTKKMLGEERRPGFYSELEGEPFYFVPVKFTPGSAPAAAAMSEAEIEKRAKELAAKMAAEAAKPGTTVSVPMAPAPVPAPAAVVDPLAGVSKDKPYQNSLGMAFVPAGTPGVFFSVWETRVKDFEAFVEESGHDAISENAHGEPAYTLESGAEWKQAGGSWRDPRFPTKQSGEHPVVCVSYLDAEAFCAWLTKKERASGKIPVGASYRLPSDSEWSRACGGSEYPWGETYPPKSADGNYLGAEGMVGVLAGKSTELSQAGFRDGAARTSAVGMFKENRFGLYDMGGNAQEWCSTWYEASMNEADVLKAFPVLKDDKGGQTYRVLRGASWVSLAEAFLRSSFRGRADPRARDDSYGFRCVLVVAGG
jgi:formylglycine-generating enzyme required for sulfatase activity